MFVLGVWTLASALGCCIGYTITQRSGQYYDNQGNPHDYQWQTSEYPSGPSEYQWQPLEYQWQPLDYQWQPAEYQQQPLEYQWQPMDYQWQPSEYQWQPTENQVQPYGYQSYDYRPVDYQPYYYQPYDYKPYEYFTTPMTVNPASSYSSYYHYYYPTSKPLVPYGYATKPSLPYAEEQKLLQVYRLIRVIVVFRYPVHQPVTSLDLLVHELTDVALQNKLVELLYHVPGYGQVAQLVHDPSIDVKHSFVNDYWRLLLAIQRALNPLDLTTLPDGYLREKLRELRDQANSLTVEQIEAELYQGLPAHAKEAEESNVLENPLGEVEAKEFHENYNAVVEGEDIDEPEEKKLQKPKGEAEILDDLANALEQYLKEQKSVESNHFTAASQTQAKTCETEDYDEGVCVSIEKCDEFREALSEGLSSGQRIRLKREQEKCEDDEQEDLVCCKRKPRPTIPRSFEDRKPLTKGYHDHLPDHTVCGLDSADRIFHGNLTYLDQYPWLVLIQYIDEDENEAFNCGGSLINNRYVLTAAHCINNMIAGVRLGEWDLEKNPDCVTRQDIIQCAPPVLDVGIERIVIHKNYTHRISKGGKIDMALLRLDRDITFGKYIAPVCLPKTEAEATLQYEKPMFVAGWGMTENGTVSSKKLFVDVSNVDLKQCREKINAPLIKIDETMICALGGGGKDACQGDSGGPLMEIQTTDAGVDRFFLKGVVSKGLSCGSDKPGFYTNVFQQIDWIVSNMMA